MENEELNESAVGYALWGSALSKLVAAGTISTTSAILIYLAPVISAAAFFLWLDGTWIKKAKQMYQDFKDKKELDENKVAAVAKEAEAALERIKHPGKKRYLKGLISQYKHLDLTEKDYALKIQRQIQNYVKRNEIKEELRKRLNIA